MTTTRTGAESRIQRISGWHGFRSHCSEDRAASTGYEIRGIHHLGYEIRGIRATQHNGYEIRAIRAIRLIRDSEGKGDVA